MVSPKKEYMLQIIECIIAVVFIGEKAAFFSHKSTRMA